MNDGYARKFDSLQDMNQRLVDNINNMVGEDDILIHLGDWSFGGFDKIEEFRSQINCKNIHLTFGNHDHHIERNKEGIQSGWPKTKETISAPKEGISLLDKY